MLIRRLRGLERHVLRCLEYPHDIALHRPSREVHGKPSDRKGPTIRGLTFTQYAFRAIDIEGKKPSTGPNEEPTDDPVDVSDPADHGKEVVGTTLENVTISFTSRVAGYFRGDNFVMLERIEAIGLRRVTPTALLARTRLDPQLLQLGLATPEELGSSVFDAFSRHR